MIKVLFLAGTPGLLKNTNKYNGGGWIASLQKEIERSYSDLIKISLAFPNDHNSDESYEGTEYYGIETIKHTFRKYDQKEAKFCERIKEVINAVCPDVILCFGTENGFGLASTLTDIPVVIHLQGILNPYYEAWMPQGLSWRKWLLGNKNAILTWLALKEFKKRERKMFRSCKYFIGRTDWDQKITRLLAPQAEYFYCSEMLRPVIYNSDKIWTKTDNQKKHIVSIISGSIYKGGDLILRASKVLKENVSFDFVWEVYGINDMSVWEKLAHVKHDDVNISIKGVINATQLIDVVCSADVYVHPSYIENSPNTVCEAQLLGAPVIVTDVGGTSTLVKHEETGIVVPANDPYLMAAEVSNLILDQKKASLLGKNARKVALGRHQPSIIVEDLIGVFNKLVKDNK